MEVSVKRLDILARFDVLWPKVAVNFSFLVWWCQNIMMFGMTVCTQNDQIAWSFMAEMDISLWVVVYFKIFCRAA